VKFEGSGVGALDTKDCSSKVIYNELVGEKVQTIFARMLKRPPFADL
jgi:hypothetical protein